MATIKPFANSIWPNALKTDTEGYVIFYPLGTNKVDINTVKWPKGDKLITPFLYEGEEDKLVGFVDTESLISGENSIIYLPYNHIEIQFPSIEKGTLQIHAPNATTKKASWSDDVFEDIPEAQFKYKGCKTVDDMTAVDADFKTNDVVDGVWSEPLWDLENGTAFINTNETLTSFNTDLYSLTNGYQMFYMCVGIKSFDSDLSSLTIGNQMFIYCYFLESFTSDLSNLTEGSCMFLRCNSLKSFDSNLSSLTDGSGMFSGCKSLTSFTSKLKCLINGEEMFGSCPKLTHFNSDLSTLIKGAEMFRSCPELISFNSNLSSLTDAKNMFDGCKLDAQSVVIISHTLPQRDAKPTDAWSEGNIEFGIGCDDTEEDKLLFAQECGYETWQELLDEFSAKNWTVTFQCNGRPTEAATYGMRRGEKLPVYTKLEEVTDEKYYNYTSIDCSKKYNIHYFHSTNGSTEGFDIFSSLEEAISTYNVTPKN